MKKTRIISALIALVCSLVAFASIAPAHAGSSDVMELKIPPEASRLLVMPFACRIAEAGTQFRNQMSETLAKKIKLEIVPSAEVDQWLNEHKVLPEKWNDPQTVLNIAKALKADIAFYGELQNFITKEREDPAEGAPNKYELATDIRFLFDAKFTSISDSSIVGTIKMEVVDRDTRTNPYQSITEVPDRDRVPMAGKILIDRAAKNIAKKIIKQLK